MNAQAIGALIIAALSFFSGWQIQSWHFGAQEKDRAKQEFTQYRADSATAIRRVDNIVIAQNVASLRERSLRVDVAAHRNALIRLSDATGQLLQAAADSQASCLVAASTFRDLYEQSEEERGSLAEKADRHVIDIKKLLESWPTDESAPLTN